MIYQPGQEVKIEEGLIAVTTFVKGGWVVALDQNSGKVYESYLKPATYCPPQDDSKRKWKTYQSLENFLGACRAVIKDKETRTEKLIGLQDELPKLFAQKRSKLQIKYFLETSLKGSINEVQRYIIRLVDLELSEYPTLQEVRSFSEKFNICIDRRIGHIQEGLRYYQELQSALTTRLEEAAT